MDITWLSGFAKKWLAAESQGRVPHAVLLAGPTGVGKRAAAAWLASRKLGIGTGPLPQYPCVRPEHADLHWVSPPEDKVSILIDQVRSLVDEFSMTSYSGRGKVAVIEPANSMTHSAANSLLKTLEEPRGDALLVLVADRSDRLPATIYSRCQRIDIVAPGEEEGLRWLDRLSPGNNWLEPLRAAGFAPLGAIEAAERHDTIAALAREFAAVAAHDASPVDVAAAWAKLDAAVVLEWLARTVAALARRAAGSGKSLQGSAISDSVLQRIDRRNLFCYLDIINRLRGKPAGSYNVQATLEGLLIDWATGLADLPGPDTPDAMLLLPGRHSAREG